MPPKVRKNILKKNVAITDEQKSVFEQAFCLGKQVIASSGLDLKSVLQKMTLEELKEAQEFLQPNRGTNSAKVAKFYTQLTAFKQLDNAKCLIENAMEKFRQLVQEEMQKCCADANGSIRIENLRGKVDVAIGVKQEMATQHQQVLPSAPVANQNQDDVVLARRLAEMHLQHALANDANDAHMSDDPDL